MMYQAAEDAFAMDPSEQIVLRILSGGQKGAEMALRPASYTLGTGEAADIVIADGSVRSEHVEISVGADGVTVKAIEGHFATVEGRVDPGRTHRTTAACVLLVGLVAIAIGPRSTDWSALAHPEDEAEPPTEAPEPKAETEAEPGSEEDAAEPAADKATEAEPAPPTDEVAERVQAPAPAAAPRRPKRRYLVAAGVLALVIGSGALSLYLGARDGSALPTTLEAAATAAPTPRVQATEILQGLGLTALQVQEEPGLGLAVTGMIDTVAERDGMIAAFEDAGLTVVDRTRVAEQIVDAVAFTLSAVDWPEANYGDHLEIRHLGAGRVEVDGFLGPEVDRNALRRRLEADVPGISDLRFTRSDLGYWRADLTTRIDAAGLGDWLTVTTRGAMLHVEGELTAAQGRTWTGVGEEFLAVSKGWPRISIAVSALPDFVTNTSAGPGNAAPARRPIPATPPELLRAMQGLEAELGISGASLPTGAAPEAQTPAPTPAPVPIDIAVQNDPRHQVIGVIASSARGAIALLASGRNVRAGDELTEGATVVEVRPDGVFVEAGDKTFTLKMKDQQ